MTTFDVTNAIREQNVQVAGGAIGQSPSKGSQFQLTVSTQGRLQTPEQFGNIIVRTNADGALTRLRDVARVELGVDAYNLRARLDNQPAVAIVIFEAPNANALEMAADVRSTMETLKKDFPPGLKYEIVYDTTRFVQ